MDSNHRFRDPEWRFHFGEWGLANTSVERLATGGFRATFSLGSAARLQLTFAVAAPPKHLGRGSIGQLHLPGRRGLTAPDRRSATVPPRGGRTTAAAVWEGCGTGSLSRALACPLSARTAASAPQAFPPARGLSPSQGAAYGLGRRAKAGFFLLGSRAAVGNNCYSIKKPAVTANGRRKCGRANQRWRAARSRGEN